MYKLVIEERKAGSDAIRGLPLTVAVCRISALASADYCLGCRQEMGRSSFVWHGTPGDIRRLFEAERLGNAFPQTPDEGKEYTVRFLGTLPACA